MVKMPLPHPTEVELQILRILWELGPCTARDVHKRLEAEKGTNYSTSVKMLSIMLDKGLVKRDENAQPHLYRAVLTREHAGRRMITELIDKIYNGSAATLVLQALSSRRASPGELDEVRKLLDEIDRQTGEP